MPTISPSPSTSVSASISATAPAAGLGGDYLILILPRAVDFPTTVSHISQRPFARGLQKNDRTSEPQSQQATGLSYGGGADSNQDASPRLVEYFIYLYSVLAGLTVCDKVEQPLQRVQRRVSLAQVSG
ncbi:hypothetical protein E4U55_006087 [Claviceps digitariae]|nr:hypothetical protein E4U55_006087 [Claviceps digitariae]